MPNTNKRQGRNVRKKGNLSVCCFTEKTYVRLKNCPYRNFCLGKSFGSIWPDPRNPRPHPREVRLFPGWTREVRNQQKACVLTRMGGIRGGVGDTTKVSLQRRHMHFMSFMAFSPTPKGGRKLEM